MKPAAAEIVPEDQDSPIICLSPVFWRQIKGHFAVCGGESLMQGLVALR